ncbi:hypothetical protein TGARI_368370, partial [Toxoplasma gondii ARI]
AVERSGSPDAAEHHHLERRRGTAVSPGASPVLGRGPRP